jgi:hypothetical protein
MSQENPLWGAPGRHGELLKLGIDIGQTSVSVYILGGRDAGTQNISRVRPAPIAARFFNGIQF